MTEEQRQAALEAIDRLEEDAIFNQDNCFNGVNPVEDVNIIRSALKAPPVSVIEGLEGAIQLLIMIENSYSREAEECRLANLYLMQETFKEKSNMIRKCVKVCKEYSKLQKGE